MGDMWRSSQRCATVVKCLAPHLSTLLRPDHSSPYPLGFRLQPLLPAAAQLEQVTPIATDSQTLSLLGHFCMLRELYIFVEHSVLLTLPLPQLHTLHLTFFDRALRECHVQCLFSQAPALRQLILDHVPRLGNRDYHIDRCALEALVGLKCQQLDLLTLETHTIDEHPVKLPARIQCPLKLSINVFHWSFLGSAPLLALLARVPNLVALKLVTWCTLWGAYALRDQRGAVLPGVQRLEMMYLRLHMNDSHVPLQSIMSMFPALKHLSLHSDPALQVAEQPDIHTRLWHPFRSCAKLTSLTCV